MNGSWEATRQFASGTRTLTTLGQKFDIDMSRIDLFKKEDYGFLPAFLSHHQYLLHSSTTASYNSGCGKWSCKQGNQNTRGIIVR